MIVRVLSLVFLFILPLRLSSEKSVAEVVCKRYNDNIVKQFRKFEKLDYKIRKNEADLEFLTPCQHNLKLLLPIPFLRNSPRFGFAIRELSSDLS